MRMTCPKILRIKIKTYEKKCWERYEGDPKELLKKCQKFWPIKILACILIPLAFITGIILCFKKEGKNR